MDDDKPSLEDVLAHHGIKGQKWGVRRKRDTSGASSGFSSSTSNGHHLTPGQKRTAKKVAIGVGILAAIAGTAYVGYTLNKSGALPFSTIKKAATTAKGEQFAAKVLKEPTDIIHASRGHGPGFTFVKRGGLDDPLGVYERAFGSNSGAANVFKKLSDGTIAASFHDPEGRVDRAGRLIPHEMIIPKHMTQGINSLDDVKEKIWPQVKDSYADFYKIRS